MYVEIVKFIFLMIQDDCDCQTLFIRAKKVVADRQGKALGKYTLGSDLHNGKVFFSKSADDKTFYLKYEDGGIFLTICGCNNTIKYLISNALYNKNDSHCE